MTRDRGPHLIEVDDVQRRHGCTDLVVLNPGYMRQLRSDNGHRRIMAIRVVLARRVRRNAARHRHMVPRLWMAGREATRVDQPTLPTTQERDVTARTLARLLPRFVVPSR